MIREGKKAKSVASQYFSPNQASKLLGISGSTVLRMIHAKELDAFVMPPGNHFKITADAVLAFTEEHKIPLTETAHEILESKRNYSKTH